MFTVLFNSWFLFWCKWFSVWFIWTVHFCFNKSNGIIFIRPFCKPIWPIRLLKEWLICDLAKLNLILHCWWKTWIQTFITEMILRFGAVHGNVQVLLHFQNTFKYICKKKSTNLVIGAIVQKWLFSRSWMRAERDYHPLTKKTTSLSLSR